MYVPADFTVVMQQGLHCTCSAQACDCCVGIPTKALFTICAAPESSVA